MRDAGLNLAFFKLDGIILVEEHISQDAVDFLSFQDYF